MENIKPELLTFLTATDAKITVLTVEGGAYLQDLRQMLPRAELYAVFADPEDEEIALCENLGINFATLDIYEKPLTFPHDYFDYIISDLTLEKAANPQDIAAGFGLFIKPTGAWLTSFRNIRHWSVLADIMEGHYYNVVSRLYARQEFERLLYASFYKEVKIRPQFRRDEKGRAEKLALAGFDNVGDDLNAEFYLVRAARSMPELSLLKSMYDPDTRKELSRIIHRIEYDVFAYKECARFWQFCDEKNIFADYAAAFVEQTVFHHGRFYDNLFRNTPKERLSFLRQMAEAARREALSEDSVLLYENILRKINGNLL